MNFSARVNIEGPFNEIEPRLLVEHSMPGEVITDADFHAALKDVPREVREYISNLPGVRGRADVWTEDEDGEDQQETIHSLAHFGDQEQAHGIAAAAFLMARIIEVMTENTDNWTRKPGGCWTFSRDFEMEPFEA